jgi:hypothetical protein
MTGQRGGLIVVGEEQRKVALSVVLPRAPRAASTIRTRLWSASSVPVLPSGRGLPPEGHFGYLEAAGSVGGGRMIHMRKRLAAAVAAVMAGVAAPAMAADPGFEVNAGFTGQADSIYGYAGVVAALNGSIKRDGALVRLGAGIGQYTYDSAPGIRRTIGHQRADAMMGYQVFLGTVRLTAYAGVDLQNHDNNDPASEIRGTTVGGKGQLEVFAPMGDRFYGIAVGNLSTIYTSYYAFAKVGYIVVDRLSVGPEAAIHGNTRYDHGSAGAFVGYDFTQTTTLSVSGGYQWDLRTPAPGLNKSEGVYGSVHLTLKF